MTTHWIVKHIATGAYQTRPSPTEQVAWAEFGLKIGRLPHGNKVLIKDYIAVEVQITETGVQCGNLEW